MILSLSLGNMSRTQRDESVVMKVCLSLAVCWVCVVWVLVYVFFICVFWRVSGLAALVRYGFHCGYSVSCFWFVSEELFSRFYMLSLCAECVLCEREMRLRRESVGSCVEKGI